MKDHSIPGFNHQQATTPCRRDSGHVQPELEGCGTAWLNRVVQSLDRPGLSLPFCAMGEGGRYRWGLPPFGHLLTPSSDSNPAQLGNSGLVTTSWILSFHMQSWKKISTHLRGLCMNHSVAST